MRSKFSSIDSPQWFLLVHNGTTIGYRKQIAGTSFFSRDGYSWSGTPLVFEREWIDTGLREKTGGKRIYTGQKVQVRPPEGEYIQGVLVRFDNTNCLWVESKDTLVPLSSITRTEEAGSVQFQVLGDLYDSEEFVRKFSELGARHQQLQTGSWLDAVVLWGCFLLGAVISIGLQWWKYQSLGPLWTSLGGVVGAGGAFWYHQKRLPGWLSRAKLKRLSIRVTALQAGLSLAVYAACIRWGGPLWKEAQERPVTSVLAMTVAMALLSLVTIILTGDIVAWLTGGYSEEKEE